MIQRRGFLAGILAAGVAPVFIKPEILMPAKQIIRLNPQDWMLHEQKILRYAAAYGAGPLTFSELVAQSFHKHQGQLTSNLMQHNALLSRLQP